MFKKFMKVSAQFLSVALVAVSLVGCGQAPAREPLPDSDDWREAQVIMHEIRVKNDGTMTLGEMLDLGFKKDTLMSMVAVPSKLEAGDDTTVSLVATDGNKELYDVHVTNNTGKKTKVENCTIDRIYSLDPTDESDGIISARDISLVNGVGIGVGSEEVANLMGEPDEEVIKDDADNFYKKWIYKTNYGEIVMFFWKDTDTMSTMVITF